MKSSQLSHPHRSKLMGMARKISYLLQLPTLASLQILTKDPIDAFPAARCALMS